MTQVSEYFEQKTNRTLDDLEKELTAEEIRKIIYSRRIIIKKESDGKIHFNYLNVSDDEVRKVENLRKESGITEEDKIVVGPYKVLDSLEHDKKIQDEREVEAKKKEAKKKEIQKKADANNS